jgi:hypothetical protein
MTEVPSSVAVCDPRVISGAIFADEAAYLAKEIPLRRQHGIGQKRDDGGVAI